MGKFTNKTEKISKVLNTQTKGLYMKLQKSIEMMRDKIHRFSTGV